jgi:hypothetical protein
MAKPSSAKTYPARLLGAGALAAALVAATLASAQSRPRAAPGHKPKLTPDSTAVDDGGAPAPASSAAPASASDAGPIPPPPAEESADGGKLSPLTPAANEFSDGGVGANPVDYDRLLTDIAALRARVAAVSDTLFHSRIGIALQTDGDHGRIASLSVSLDDGVVWTAPPTFRASDATTIFDHAVAPGHHAVTVDVERRDDRNDAFRSAQRSRFIVDVPADQKLLVELRLGDDSNMGGDFPNDRKGEYDLRIRARAQAQSGGR